MEELVKEALRFVMVTEQNTERLFNDAAASSPEGYGRTVLERLAAEQRMVIEEIRRRYPSAAGSCDRDNPPLLHRNESMQERRLLEVLQLGLHHKHHNLVQYRAFLDAFRAPVMCDIFGMAFGFSHLLLERVAEEYTQAKQKLHRPLPNRRVKRTHIRTGYAPVPPPNRHTQLFISLLDCGRRPLQGRDF